MNLDSLVEELEGVGEAKGKKLEKMGIITLRDLLQHYPCGHEDRTNVYNIVDCPIGDKVCIRVTITEAPRFSAIRHGLDVVNVKATDQKEMVKVGIFNQREAMKALQVGNEYMLFGTMQKNEQFGYNFTCSLYEPVGKLLLTGRMVPRYHLTTGISNVMLRTMIFEALEKCGHLIEETLPEDLAKSFQGVEFSVRNVHFPENKENLALAKDRLAFEELFFLSLGMAMMKNLRVKTKSHVIPILPVEDFPLPFTPTGAQQRVMEEIAQNMSRGECMNRLVQGDVGSGKTAVAAYAGFLTMKAGLQVAMMVPTEVLAKQHYKSLSQFLEPMGFNVGCLTASMTAKEKRDVKKDMMTGELDFVVGTHALLSKDVEFHNLALVVVDEQHRFGVEQRAKLSDKAEIAPHVLVMSATPIPRTMALMVYGDLEVSVIDELPPLRTPIETFVIDEAKRQRMYGFIAQQVEEGRQIYIICPSVEDSGDEFSSSALKSVTTFVEHLQRNVYPQFKLEFLHGKRKAKEKEAVMGAFSRGELDILVSTTVIEVGVDVPNANLILIENADRFGLSQLHQLRGRVGRGKHKSYCLLMTDSRQPDTLHRLKTLASTTDGFKISEEDLKIRGPGDFFGNRQHGLPSLKLADLSGDMRTLSFAQISATNLVAQDPKLEKPEHEKILFRVQRLFQGTSEIFN